MTIRDLIGASTVQKDTDIRAARSILAHILDVSYDHIFFHEDSIILSDRQKEKFDIFYNLYKSGKPLSKIINQKYFWNHDFFVTDDVLDPRQDSETLVESVLSYFDKDANLSILDIGTGSGCLIISLLSEFKNATGVASDISEKAIEIAKINAEKILNGERISFKISDFASTIDDKFDIIISNPPYIRSDEIESLDDNVKLYDPILALDGGKSGLEAYEKIAINIRNLLKKDSMIFLEIGYDQAKEVRELFEKHGYRYKKTCKDIQNHDRVLVFSP